MTDPRLEALPPELLLMIFALLPPSELMQSVRLVCVRFHRLISNRQWWLSRIQADAHIRLSAIEQDDEDFDAAHSFAEMETEERRWNQWPQQEKKTADGHIGTVDALRLFRRDGHRFCLSGSRDRAIKLWDVNRIESDEDKATWMSTAKNDAHTGWIWYIDDPIGDQFLSCGWDDYIKSWQIGQDGLLELSAFKAPSAVTCVQRLPGGEAVCSTLRRQIYILDVHNGLQEITSFKFHKAPVFAMASKDNYIYTAGEDKRLIMVDRRNTSKPLKIRSPPGNSRNAIQSLSLAHNQLVCGTSQGTIIILNPQGMAPVHQYESGIPNVVWQVKHNRGSVMMLSRSRQLKVFTAGVQPRLRAESACLDNQSDPSRFDYLKGDLVIGGGLGTVSFWTCPDNCHY